MTDKQFEYRTCVAPSPASSEHIVELLNRYGDNGWELCGNDYGQFIFKREKSA